MDGRHGNRRQRLRGLLHRASGDRARPAGGLAHRAADRRSRRRARRRRASPSATRSSRTRPPAPRREILTDSFYLSYLTSSSDVDYARFAAPPAGTVTTFHLSHLPADYDLVVYGPPETQLRPSITSAVPLDEPPVIDDGVDPTHATDALPSQTLDDLRLQTNLPMVGVSAMRGTDPEDIVVVSQGGGGFYTIQITGYNAATSPKPYMLRVSTTPPRVTSNVTARTGTGTVGPALPNNLPAGLNTVFLVNRQQLQARYDSTQASNVIQALQSDSSAFANLGFPNVILSVDRFATVQTAYANWNAHPGDPAAANGVVAAINAVLDSQIRAKPNGGGLKYLVIVGGDQVMPFARLDDFTVTASNEAGYASTFGTNTELFATLNAGQMLSDDPYGDVNPVPYLNRQLYIPELAVGRLVETPAQIVATLNRFVAPTVAGPPRPDDLADDGLRLPLRRSAGCEHRACVGASAPPRPTLLTLISNSWTLQNLDRRLPAGAAALRRSRRSTGTPRTSSSSRPPATGDDAPPLFTTTAADRLRSRTLTNRLVFSMGCHAGLSGRGRDRHGQRAPRSARLAAGVRAEGRRRLPRQHGLRLRRQPRRRVLGGAEPAVRAAHRGSARRSATRSSQRSRGTTAGSASSASTTRSRWPSSRSTGCRCGRSADRATRRRRRSRRVRSRCRPRRRRPRPSSRRDRGVDARAARHRPGSGDRARGRDLRRQSGQLRRTRLRRSARYWSAQDGVQVTQLRPIQPKLYIPLTGTTGHGALITELTSGDTGCVDPVFARPLVDLSANESELAFGDVAFPSKLQTVRTFVTPTGLQQRVVLVTGSVLHATRAARTPDPQRRRPAAVQPRRRARLPLDEHRLHLAGVPADRGHQRGRQRRVRRRRDRPDAERSAGRSSRSSSACAAARTRSGRSRTSRSRLRNPARWTGGVPIDEPSSSTSCRPSTRTETSASARTRASTTTARPTPPPPDRRRLRQPRPAVTR